MYLSKRKIHALELALEAMENFGVYSDEANEAINTIVEMLNSAITEQKKHKPKKRSKLEVIK